MVSQETLRSRLTNLSTSQSDLGCLNQGNPTPCDAKQRAPNKVHPFRLNTKYHNIIFVVIMMVVPSLGAQKPWEDKSLISSPPKISRADFIKYIDQSRECRHEVATLIHDTWQDAVDKTACRNFPQLNINGWKVMVDSDLGHWACLSFKKYLAQETRIKKLSRANTSMKKKRASERAAAAARTARRRRARGGQKSSRDSKPNQPDSKKSKRPSVAEMRKSLARREKQMRKMMGVTTPPLAEEIKSEDETSDPSTTSSANQNGNNNNNKFAMISQEKFVEYMENFRDCKVFPQNEETTDYLREDVAVNSFDDETQIKQYLKWAARNSSKTSRIRNDLRIKVTDIGVRSKEINGKLWGSRYAEYKIWYTNYRNQ